MALLEAYMIETHVGTGNLELTAPPGESFLIKNIRVFHPAEDYITIKIEKTSVGCFRAKGILGSHVPFHVQATQHSHDWRTSTTAPAGVTTFAGLVNAGGVEIKPYMIGNLAAATTYSNVNQVNNPISPMPDTILDFLRKIDAFKGYPVATGQTFIIEGAGQTGAVQMVEYEIYDAGDITPDMENGSEAPTYIYINYGHTGADIHLTGDYLYDTCVTPPEFPDFPFGKTVPAGTEIDLIGICASDFAPGDCTATDWTETRFLKMIHNRKVLFDKNRKGLLMRGMKEIGMGTYHQVGRGQSVLGNFTNIDAKPPFILPTPKTFATGSELNIFLTVEHKGTGKAIYIDWQVIGAILKVRRI